jgi:hypothetical protein
MCLSCCLRDTSNWTVQRLHMWQKNRVTKCPFTTPAVISLVSWWYERFFFRALFIYLFFVAEKSSWHPCCHWLVIQSSGKGWLTFHPSMKHFMFVNCRLEKIFNFFSPIKWWQNNSVLTEALSSVILLQALCIQSCCKQSYLKNITTGGNFFNLLKKELILFCRFQIPKIPLMSIIRKQQQLWLLPAAGVRIYTSNLTQRTTKEHNTGWLKG